MENSAIFASNNEFEMGGGEQKNYKNLIINQERQRLEAIHSLELETLKEEIKRLEKENNDLRQMTQPYFTVTNQQNKYSLPLSPAGEIKPCSVEELQTQLERYINSKNNSKAFEQIVSPSLSQWHLKIQKQIKKLIDFPIGGDSNSITSCAVEIITVLQSSLIAIDSLSAPSTSTTSGSSSNNINNNNSNSINSNSGVWTTEIISTLTGYMAEELDGKF
jgi:hypothetical protein